MKTNSLTRWSAVLAGLLAVSGWFAVLPGAVADEKKAPAAAQKHKDIDIHEAEKLLAEKKEVVLLDVRTPREFRRSHLKDAKHINFYDSDFEEQVAKLDRNKTYVVYCAVGGRSAQAGEKMSKLGFQSVYNMTGGIREWQRADKPTVR